MSQLIHPPPYSSQATSASSTLPRRAWSAARLNQRRAIGGWVMGMRARVAAVYAAQDAAGAGAIKAARRADLRGGCASGGDNCNRSRTRECRRRGCTAGGNYSH